MPVQTTQSSLFSKTTAGLVSAANDKFRDAPVDTGIQRLPGGLTNAIARLQTMVVKEYADDKGMGPRGENFFRAAAVVVEPVEFKGMKLAGRFQTSQMVPLCATPKKGNREAQTFDDHWYTFQNLFKILGVPAPPANSSPATMDAYYAGAMKALTDPAKPVYIRFSTREWTPPARPNQPKPEPMVFETWHERVEWTQQHNPAASVTVNQPTTNGSAPPTLGADGLAINQSHTATVETASEPAETDEWDVDTLVEIAMGDPEGVTPDGDMATSKLRELALAAGWTHEHILEAADWSEVGLMAVNAPADVEGTTISTVPVVGQKAKFAKRDSKGEKLRNSKTSAVFDPVEVEIDSVDASAGTCTVKNVKSGKVMTDMKSKEPIAVKFEWLE